MMLLEGRQLVKNYPLKQQSFSRRPKLFQALSGVDLQLQAGTTLGLVGESGSGKSTAGEILGDLQQPSEGAVLYKGRDLRTLDRRQYRQFRRSVQFIFQNPKASMNPAWTLERSLIEPMKQLQDDFSAAAARREIRQMLPRVGMHPDCLDKLPSQLSGGQCQRIAIARALLLNPEVIICDECVSALDVSVQAQILNLLKALQRQFHTAYLFISHDMGVVHYMSDYVVVLVKGRILEQGEGEKVMLHPMQEYTQTLISSSLYRREPACAAQ